jgi:hypothetical protein
MEFFLDGFLSKQNYEVANAAGLDFENRIEAIPVSAELILTIPIHDRDSLRLGPTCKDQHLKRTLHALVANT